MAIINVGDAKQLAAALKTARDGDTILLGAGNYSGVTIAGVGFDKGVTIASADPSRPAVLTDLTVRDSRGLTFSGLELAAPKSNDWYPFEVIGSTRIVMDRLHVHGTMNDNPHDDATLLLIRNSKDVVVRDSEFEQGEHGVSFLDSERVTITGNRFHDLQTDGVRGGGTSHLVITDNHFTDFHPLPGDHPDGIQVWTTGVKTSATDILISGNVVERGSGAPVQGIFMRDEGLKLPYERVTVTNNLVVGAMYNGIAVNNAKDLTVSGNIVVAQPDQRSSIRVELSNGARILDNRASSYIVDDQSRGGMGGNVQLGQMAAAAAATLSQWVDARTDDLASFRGALLEQVVGRVSAYGLLAGQTVASKAQAGNFAVRELKGTDGADRLTAGTIGDWTLDGGAGADMLTGGSAGQSRLIGGKGDDTFVVRSARDAVVEAANEGTDLVNTYIDYTLGSNVESLRMMSEGLIGRGNAGANRLMGSAGADRLLGEGGDDTVQGGAGDDVLHGGAGRDLLRGEDGGDALFGDAGDDNLFGDAGADTLAGGDGADSIQGGTGADRLSGGAGADTFLYRQGELESGVDVIADFSAAQKDRISLSMVDANVLTAVDDKFTFIGQAGFRGVAGELRYRIEGGSTFVEGDVNGDGAADFAIQLSGVLGLKAADFLL